jgi:hypothetical protein
MLAITTTSERTGHWTKMRQSLARFSRSEASNRTQSLAAFITNMSGFRFSVHTGMWKIVHHHTDIAPAMINILSRLKKKKKKKK